MELLKATGDCAFSQRPTDLCREWPWMGTRALWLLLRGWTPPWLLMAAEPWALLVGKDRHWYWVHSSLSESSSFGISSRLAVRKKPCRCPCHTLAGPWWGRPQTLGVDVRTQMKNTVLLWKLGSWLPLLEKGVQPNDTGSNPGSPTS